MAGFDELIDELKQKRDELRVQIHLASKEVQDEWDELEGKMDSLVSKSQLGDTSEGIGRALEQLGHELKLGYQRIRDAIKES